MATAPLSDELCRLSGRVDQHLRLHGRQSVPQLANLFSYQFAMCALDGLRDDDAFRRWLSSLQFVHLHEGTRGSIVRHAWAGGQGPGVSSSAPPTLEVAQAQVHDFGDDDDDEWSGWGPSPSQTDAQSVATTAVSSEESCRVHVSFGVPATKFPVRDASLRQAALPAPQSKLEQVRSLFWSLCGEWMDAGRNQYEVFAEDERLTVRICFRYGVMEGKVRDRRRIIRLDEAACRILWGEGPSFCLAPSEGPSPASVFWTPTSEYAHPLGMTKGFHWHRVSAGATPPPKVPTQEQYSALWPRDSDDPSGDLRSGGELVTWSLADESVEV